MMGTNYYHEIGVCEHCGHAEHRRHIGKSSFGWCFSLHVEPDDHAFPHSWDEWQEEFISGRIVDEYGEEVDTEDFYSVVTERSHKIPFDDCRWWRGYKDETHFHIHNCSQRGPNNLLRHRIDGRHCIGHGDGTWDLITGEFS